MTLLGTQPHTHHDHDSTHDASVHMFGAVPCRTTYSILSPSAIRATNSKSKLPLSHWRFNEAPHTPDATADWRLVPQKTDEK